MLNHHRQPHLVEKRHVEDGYFLRVLDVVKCSINKQKNYLQRPGEKMIFIQMCNCEDASSTLFLSKLLGEFSQIHVGHQYFSNVRVPMVGQLALFAKTVRAMHVRSNVRSARIDGGSAGLLSEGVRIR